MTEVLKETVTMEKKVCTCLRPAHSVYGVFIARRTLTGRRSIAGMRMTWDTRIQKSSRQLE